MPKSTVSRKLSELEERIGARLIQRTTRKLSLTDVGRIYSWPPPPPLGAERQL